MATTAMVVLILCSRSEGQTSYAPGIRTINDAHNCYPYDGRWADRIERALAARFPIAIEQDLNWYPATNTEPGRVVVGHGAQHTILTKGGQLTGDEPDFETYFFEHVRPAVEKALQSTDHSNWPIITLNLDFKSEEPELLQAVWAILERHQSWLTKATKTTGDSVALMTVGPILVLNGPSDRQQAVFYDRLKPGEQLLTFGAVHTDMRNPSASASVIEVEPASNYRRWWNNPWTVVEPEGQSKAAQWSPERVSRLRDLVVHAHDQGLWIRFYTLDGATVAEQAKFGWFHQYNFSSQSAAEDRWRAAISLGVDYLASDQYEELGKLIRAEQHFTTPQQNAVSVPNLNKANSKNLVSQDSTAKQQVP